MTEQSYPPLSRSSRRSLRSQEIQLTRPTLWLVVILLWTGATAFDHSLPNDFHCIGASTSPYENTDNSFLWTQRKFMNEPYSRHRRRHLDEEEKEEANEAEEEDDKQNQAVGEEAIDDEVEQNEEVDAGNQEPQEENDQEGNDQDENEDDIANENAGEAVDDQEGDVEVNQDDQNQPEEGEEEQEDDQNDAQEEGAQGDDQNDEQQEVQDDALNGQLDDAAKDDQLDDAVKGNVDDAAKDDQLDDVAKDDQLDDAAKDQLDDAAKDDQLDDAAKDDHLDDAATDDQLDDAAKDDQSGDDHYVRVYDDYYLFKEDPKPPSLLPFTTREILGYFVASLCLCVCATSGVGGGGIIVPVYVLITGLNLKIAVPIGAVTVLGGALGSTLVNLSRRHPLADRPMIDWDLVIVMEPLILVGTIVGVMLHQLMSEKLLVVLLVLLLSATAHMTLAKAMRMYQAEKRYIRQLRLNSVYHPSYPSGLHHSSALASPIPLQHPQHSSSVYGEGPHPDDVLTSRDEDDIAANGITSRSNSSTARMAREEKERILIQNPDYVTLRSDLMEQEKFTSRTKIAALVLMFAVLITVNVMVGGGSYGSPWGIACGSFAFWMVHVIMIVFLIISAWAAHTYVVARHEIKELVCFDFTHGDIDWKKSQVLYPLTFIGAGFFAGALGIGGGVITVPLMLHFGLHPAVAAASSSCMIFFTSFASTTIFSVFDLLLTDFAIVGFLVGFFSALCGQYLMRQARQVTSASGRNFDRNSYTAFVIGGVILISALLMTIQYVLIIVEQPEGYEGGLCEGFRFL